MGNLEEVKIKEETNERNDIHENDVLEQKEHKNKLSKSSSVKISNRSNQKEKEKNIQTDMVSSPSEQKNKSKDILSPKKVPNKKIDNKNKIIPIEKINKLIPKKDCNGRCYIKKFNYFNNYRKQLLLYFPL